MKLSFPTGVSVSVTVKQPSHINNFIVKKNKANKVTYSKLQKLSKS